MSEFYLAKIPIKYYDYFSDLYNRIPPVKIAIDTFVENVVGTGFKFEMKGKETEENQKILRELEEVSDRLKIPRMMYTNVSDMLIYGNSFTEIAAKEQVGITALIRHDPRTVGVITNGKSVTAYAKVEDGTVTKCFIKDQIMHMKNTLVPLGMGWYGRSQIENLIPKIKDTYKIADIPVI